MTITINKNAVIAVLALIIVGLVGYFVGEQLNGPSQAAALPPAEATGIPLQARIAMDEFKADYDAGADMRIVDVRTPDLYAAGHIKGAVSIPEADVASRKSEIPQDKLVVLYCG
jgi:3-mercaptopyruvate sulfurtransferase SseA